jgi:hypothetical protein
VVVLLLQDNLAAHQGSNPELDPTKNMCLIKVRNPPMMNEGKPTVQFCGAPQSLLPTFHERHSKQIFLKNPKNASLIYANTKCVLYDLSRNGM